MAVQNHTCLWRGNDHYEKIVINGVVLFLINVFVIIVLVIDVVIYVVIDVVIDVVIVIGFVAIIVRNCDYNCNLLLFFPLSEFDALEMFGSTFLGIALLLVLLRFDF